MFATFKSVPKHMCVSVGKVILFLHHTHLWCDVKVDLIERVLEKKGQTVDVTIDTSRHSPQKSYKQIFLITEIVDNIE